MEPKSITELNADVSKTMTTAYDRPKQLNDQDTFNRWALSCLNDLSLRASKGRRPFRVTHENEDVLRVVFAYLNRNSDDRLLVYNDMQMSLDKGIILRGRFGIGKTLILRFIHEQRNALKLKGWFATSRQVFDFARDKSRDKGTLDEIVGKRHLDLWLDDLGAEPHRQVDYGTEDTPVGNLVSDRLDAWENLPESPRLFMSSNLSEDSIIEAYGGRLHSRIMGGCNDIVCVQETDYRQL